MQTVVIQEEPQDGARPAAVVQHGAVRAGLVFNPPRRVAHGLGWRRAFLLQTVAVERA